jgi:hypothetical protein
MDFIKKVPCADCVFNIPKILHWVFPRALLSVIYYNIVITPWAQLTPNIQVVNGARSQIQNGSLQDIGTATVLGLRLNLVF